MIAGGLNKIGDEVASRTLLLDAIHACRGRTAAAQPVSEELADRFAVAGDLESASEWYLASLEAMKRMLSEGGKLGRDHVNELSLKAAEMAFMLGERQKATDLVRLVKPSSMAQNVQRSVLAIRTAILEDAHAAHHLISQLTRSVPLSNPLVVSVLMLRARLDARSNSAQALEDLQEAARLMDKHQPPLEDYEAYYWMSRVGAADIALEIGEVDRAEHVLDEALRQALAAGDKSGIVPIVQTYFKVLSRIGRCADFTKLAIGLLQADGIGLRKTHRVPLLRLMGQAQLTIGDDNEGLRTLELARKEANELGWLGEVSRVASVIDGDDGPVDNTESQLSWYAKA